MNKEEILKLSQQENQGKPDEFEMAAYNKAYQASMLLGVVLCVILAFVSRYILNAPELALAGWMICFAMCGSNNIVTFKHLKIRSKLIAGIVEIVFAAACAVAMVILTVK